MNEIRQTSRSVNVVQREDALFRLFPASPQCAAEVLGMVGE